MNFYDFVKSIKTKNPNKIVFVRCGVFFTCLGEDAIIAEKILGLKRTCFSKQICKCWIPAIDTKKTLDKLEEKLKNVNYGVVIYNQVEEGEFEYNNKKYDLIWEHEGNEIIEEKRKALNCFDCYSNYLKREIEILKLKDEVEKLSKEINEFVAEEEKKRKARKKD